MSKTHDSRPYQRHVERIADALDRLVEHFCGPTEPHRERRPAILTKASYRREGDTPEAWEEVEAKVSAREVLMRKYGVSHEALAEAPQITPLLRQNGIKSSRLVEVLRCDTEPESLAFVQFWDSLTQTARHDIGLEVAALAASLTPAASGSSTTALHSCRPKNRLR